MLQKFNKGCKLHSSLMVSVSEFYWELFKYNPFCTGHKFVCSGYKRNVN